MKHPIRWLLASALAAAAACAQAQRMQVVTEATPYTYLRDGRVAGPATEVVETALRRAGVSDYETHLYPWARAYDLALAEPGVLIYLIARTPARETQFKWVGEFMKMDYHLYKLRERDDVAPARLEDARQYTVGVTRDDLRHQYLATKGFAKLVVSAQNIDNFRKLLARQVQMIPLPEADAADLCRQAGVDPNRLQRVLTLDELGTGLYMAFSRATPDALVERVRGAFDKMKTEGGVHKLMEGREGRR